MHKTHWISLALALALGSALAGMEYQRNAVYIDRRVHSTAKISKLAETMQRLEWAALVGILVLAAVLRLGAPGLVEFWRDAA